MSQNDKMYKLNKFVNLPESMELSQSMYKMKRFYELPNNVASTYYNGEEPQPVNATTKLEIESALRSLPTADKNYVPCNGLSELESRQKNILEKLKQFKAKLDSLMGNQIICIAKNETPQSKTHLNSVQVNWGLGLLQVIDNLNRQLQVIQKLENHHEQSLESVGKWQENILKQLTCLKNEMRNIAMGEEPRHILCHENDVQFRQKSILQIINALQLLLKTEISALQNNMEKNGVIHDVVIASNVTRPPYFLIPIKKFMQQSGLNVYSSSSCHSSVHQVNERVSQLFQDDESKGRSENDLAFTVQWKDQPFKSLMVNPLQQCLIRGEANILRYISRLFPAVSPLNYESQGSFSRISETDYWLDLIQMKFLQGSNKERQSIMKQFNSRLGSSKWLDGTTCSLVDIFAWSVILQLGLTKELPSNVSSWFKEINIISKFIEETRVCDGRSTLSNTESQNPCTAKHVNQKELIDYLTRIGIKYQMRTHPEVFTVEALMQHVADMPGLHMKNLFLKDKKKNLYLLAARHDAQVNLNEVGKQIGAEKLRFGDENIMFDILGVKQGCVTLFALINDRNHLVKLLLDAEALHTKKEFINFHPMSNSATLGISPTNLQIFLDQIGHDAQLINI